MGKNLYSPDGRKKQALFVNKKKVIAESSGYEIRPKRGKLLSCLTRDYEFLNDTHFLKAVSEQ